MVDVNLDTNLLSAANFGVEKAVHALLEAGADKNAAKQNGATALHIAAQNGHEAVVSALLAAGADKNAALQDGATPVFLAAQKGHLGCK